MDHRRVDIWQLRVIVKAKMVSGALKSVIRVNRFGWGEGSEASSPLYPPLLNRVLPPLNSRLDSSLGGGGKLVRAGYDRRSSRVLQSLQDCMSEVPAQPLFAQHPDNLVFGVTVGN